MSSLRVIAAYMMGFVSYRWQGKKGGGLSELISLAPGRDKDVEGDYSVGANYDEEPPKGGLWL